MKRAPLPNPASHDERLISVIVPIYNVEDHVEACIASLRAQTHRALDVLMVDDGSDDASAARALDAAGDDPRFRLISQANAGLSAARNRGLEAAQGEYVAFVDSDDRVHPNFLAALLQALDTHPESPWVACGIRNRFPNGTTRVHSAIHDAPDPVLAPGTQLFTFRTAEDVIRHYPSAWNKLYRRNFISDLRFQEGTWFEDHAFYLELALRTEGLLHIADPLYEQTRGRPGQITETDSDRIFEQLTVLQDILPLLEKAILPDGPTAAQTLACRLLSERSTALRAPARRMRFATAAQKLLDARGMTYTADPKQGLSAAWALELAGTLPLSVILSWDGREEAPFVATLAAIAGQNGPGFELLLLCDTEAAADRAETLIATLPYDMDWAQVLRSPGRKPGSAKATGLKNARGRYVTWFDAGDLPDPWALHDRIEALLATEADFSLSGRYYGPAGTPHAGFESAYVPAHNNSPATFHATPRQALAADLVPSGMTFRRAFLQNHRLSPAACERYGTWPMALEVLLLGERGVYLPQLDVVLPAPSTHPYPLYRLARDHTRLCASLSADARNALPHGWERRLLARILRLWLLDGPARGRVKQALAQLGAAALIAWRGMGRSGQYWPAGFDAQVGPKFSRLFDSIGLLRLALPRERARLAAGGLLPGEAHVQPLSLHDLYSNHRSHTFPLAHKGTARLRIHFGSYTFAHITFYAKDGKTVPLHLSLRYDAGLIICNDTRTDGIWRKERHIPYKLPRDGLELIIEIAPAQHKAAVRIWIGDDLIWTLKTRNLAHRQGLSRLDQITHLTLEGGAAQLDLCPDVTGSKLGLDGRLAIRLPGAATPAGVLSIDSVETPLDCLEMHMTPEQPGQQAILPARAWASVADAEALTLRYSHPGQPDQTLMITRQELATQIAKLLHHGLPMGDADLILQIIEQVALAELTPYLDASAQAELARFTQRFALEDLLPDLAHTPPHKADPLGPLMTDLATRARQTQHSGILGEALIQDLPPDRDAARHLMRLLVEKAIKDGHMETLFEAARKAGLLPMPLDTHDIWALSASLPFLWQDGCEADVLNALRHITQQGPGWRVTPALAWIGRQALTGDNTISPPGRIATLEMLLEWLQREAQDYWGRSACQALTTWAAELAVDLHRLPAPLRHHATDTLITAYGLSRTFWEKLAEQDSIVPLPPRLMLAKSAFARLSTATDSDAKAAALTQLQHLGAGDMARARIEYLGPAGVPVTQGAALTPAELLPTTALGPHATGQFALRHMAAPGTVPAAPETADMVAETIRSMATEQDVNPLLPLQRRVHAQITHLLAHPKDIDADLPALLSDLERLSFENARYLGLGLAMTLLPALPGAADRRMVADWLIARDQSDIQAYRQEVAYWRRKAPAVRMGLARLSTINRPEAADVLAHYTRLPQENTKGQTVARALPPLPRISATGTLPTPHPLNDVIVTVFSCHPYLDSRIPALRKSWLSDLGAMGIPYVIVVGDGDGTLNGDILQVAAPDDYEGLPAKTLATIDWVRHHTSHTHMLKIDDDCLVDAHHLFGDLSWRTCDYMGRKLHRAPGQMDRVWHQAKASSPRGKLELDKSPEPSTYADGGSGYLLSRDAMDAACTAAQKPEGRALIAASFMEDKLLGDLLHLGGISLSTPGYLTSIRRRTFSAATPVAFWNVGFYPSRAAPTQQVHLDTHLGHKAVRALRGTPQLAPRKIWPSFQPPRLGYQSNALELLSTEDSVARAREADVAVVAVMRNEQFMLPHFLAHYRTLGVTSFLIADNASDDGTREFLLEQEDVALFSVDTDYKLSHYGVAWQQAMMSAFRIGRWSLVADADELLVWQAKQIQTLPDLLQNPAFEQAEAARIFMLDMYPQGPLEDATFNQTAPFDMAGFADREPFTENPLTRGPFSDQTLWTSALRHRLIPGTRPDLFAAQKIALLKYQPWMRLSAGLHFVTGARRAAQDLFFGHFKYNADFYRKAQAEVARKQHFNDAEEYRKYLALASEGRAIIFDRCSLCETAPDALSQPVPQTLSSAVMRP